MDMLDECSKYSVTRKMQRVGRDSIQLDKSVYFFQKNALNIRNNSSPSTRLKIVRDNKLIRRSYREYNTRKAV